MKTKHEQEIEEFKQEIQYKYYTPMGWNVVKTDDLLKKKLPESEFLVEKLLPKNGITILAGNPSSYKSWVLLSIAIAVSSNRFLFNHFNTKEAKVLYVDEESSQTETQRRLKFLKPPYMTLTDFMNFQGFKIDNQEQRNALLDFANWRDYQLLVFDSLRDLHSKNENDSTEAQQIMDYFKEFTKKGITILLSHHNRKESFLNPNDSSQILRGSTAILAGVDSLLAITKMKETEKRTELVISQPKLRQGKPTKAFKINFFIETEQGINWEFLGEVENEEDKINKAKIAIKELLNKEELYQKEIIERLVPLGHSPATIRRTVKELREDKEIQERQEGKRIYFGL